MKRFLYALLIALTALAAQTVRAEGAPLVGVWALTGASYQGMAVDPASRGMDMVLRLNADGSALLAMMDLSEQGAWSPSERGATVVVGGSELSCVAGDDGTMTVALGEVALTLSRELSAVLGDAVLDDFNGVWTAVRVRDGAIPPGQEMEIAIDFGSVTLIRADARAGGVAAMEGSALVAGDGRFSLALCDDGTMTASLALDGWPEEVVFIPE